MHAQDLDLIDQAVEPALTDADFAACEAAVVTGVCPTVTDADLAA